MYNNFDQFQLMKWSNEEKQKLADMANDYHSKNIKIKWDNILKSFPGRTKTQIKAQYTNYLKTKQTYKPWSTYEKMLLSFCVSIYGHDWAFIQKNYFPHRNKEQLRVKFFYIRVLRQERQKIIDDIKLDNI